MKSLSVMKSQSGKSSFISGILLLMLAVCAIYFASNLATEDRPVPRTFPQTFHRNDKIDSQLSAFIDEKIDPILRKTNSRNLDAVSRAKQDVDDTFDKYQQGVKPFVEDVTSWGTRFGIMGRYAGEKYDLWWKDKESSNRVACYIDEKFEKHIFTGQEFETDMQIITNNFLEDIKANQNLMLSEITEQIEMSGLPIDKDLFQPENFTRQFKQNLQPVFRGIAKDSVAIGVLSFVGGMLLQDSVTNIAKSLIATISSAVATTAASSAASSAVSTGVVEGGYMYSLSAAGAGAGTVCGPACQIVGLGVGITIGVIIDWWCTDKLQQKVTDQCSSFLTNTKSVILNGEEGLIPSLNKSVSIINESYKRVINSNFSRG